MYYIVKGNKVTGTKKHTLVREKKVTGKKIRGTKKTIWLGKKVTGKNSYKIKKVTGKNRNKKHWLGKNGHQGKKSQEQKTQFGQEKMSQEQKTVYTKKQLQEKK